jgi:MFS family permease
MVHYDQCMDHPELLDDGPPVGKDLALATWGLFVALALLLFAGGLCGTLLGVRSELAKLPTIVSGLISMGYYLGFLVGSRFALTVLSRVGHIRAFAALASLLAAAILGIGMTNSAWVWGLLRLTTGLCFAGQYVVAESWLNDLADNDNRGRLLAIYNVVTVGAFGSGQVLQFAFNAKFYTGFAIASIVVSLAVAPVALSERAVAPPVGSSAHISLRDLAKTVPTGVGSCFLVGIAHGALTGLAAVFATRAGLPNSRVGLFVAAPSIGAIFLQWPISAASDDIDRRAVGALAAIGAMVFGSLLLVGPATSPMAILLIGLVGGCSYPLYSIAGAYTNDWIEGEHLNAAASQLVLLYGFGAVLGPLLSSLLLNMFGLSGYYWALILVHGLIALFFVYRMRAWRSPLAKRPLHESSFPARVFFLPATIVSITRSRRSKSDPAKQDAPKSDWAKPDPRKSDGAKSDPTDESTDVTSVK